MRSIHRTASRAIPPSPPSPLSGGLGRDIALVCLADGLVGVSFGAIAIGAGFPLWLPMLLSVVVFAGASQFMFIAILGAGGNPIAAVVAGLLVNARHLPFGLAVGDAVGNGLLRRVAGSHVMVDESTAFAMSQSDPRRRRAAFWTCGVSLFVCWNAGVLIGAFGGTLIRSTDALGMDAAFPAVLLALLMPSLREPTTRAAGLIGAVIAVGAGFVLPAGLPVLLALVTLPIAVFGRRGGRRRRPAGDPAPGDPEPIVTAEERAAIADAGADRASGGPGGPEGGSRPGGPDGGTR
jgi:4-azaleucine resistance transporter AzlC